MNKRFAAPVAGVAAVVMLIGACSDDKGPRVVVRGVVDFVGTGHAADYRMDITAEEEDGEVTGTIRFTCSPDSVPGSWLELIAVDLECADVGTDGVVIVAGEVTELRRWGPQRGCPVGDGHP